MAAPTFARVRISDGAVVCERCEIPESAFGRARGLLGRDGLEFGEGMLVDRAGSVHMFFMRFPIDVVFLDADQVVIRIASSLPPWRTVSCRGAREVVELAAGEAVFVPRDAYHGFENTSDAEVVMAWCYAGAASLEDAGFVTREEDELLTASQG